MYVLNGKHCVSQCWSWTWPPSSRWSHDKVTKFHQGRKIWFFSISIFTSGWFHGKGCKMTVMPNLLQILRPVWFSVVSLCLLGKYWQSNLHRKFAIMVTYLREHSQVSHLICIFMKLNHMRINSKMLWEASEIKQYFYIPSEMHIPSLVKIDQIFFVLCLFEWNAWRSVKNNSNVLSWTFPLLTDLKGRNGDTLCIKILLHVSG